MEIIMTIFLMLFILGITSVFFKIINYFTGNISQFIVNAVCFAEALIILGEYVIKNTELQNFIIEVISNINFNNLGPSHWKLNKVKL